jgi:hypothetical protein
MVIKNFANKMTYNWSIGINSGHSGAKKRTNNRRNEDQEERQRRGTKFEKEDEELNKGNY